jgi:hypothetical protein
MYGAPYIVDSSTSTAQAQVRLENEFAGDKSIMHMWATISKPAHLLFFSFLNRKDITRHQIDKPKFESINTKYYINGEKY